MTDEEEYNDKYTVEFLIAMGDHTWYSEDHVLEDAIVCRGEDAMVDWLMANHPPQGDVAHICVCMYTTYDDGDEE